MYTVWSFFTKKRRFTSIVIIAIVFFGGSAIFTIPKESSPSVQVPIALVTTTLPGASPADVEKLVTNTLEDPLRTSLSDLKQVTSSSNSGVSVITVEFNADANIDKSIQSVKDEVDKVKGDLPTDATDPQVTEITFGEDPVVTATISPKSTSFPKELLYSLGEIMKDELKKVNSVSSVVESGVEDRQVNVIVNRHKLSQYDLTITDVSNAIAQANISLPAGSVSVKGVVFPLRFNGDIVDTQSVASIPISVRSGVPIYLRDIARVVDSRGDAKTISRTSIAGNPSITSISFDVFKSSNAKITTVSSALQKKFDELTTENGLLSGMDIVTIYDNGERLQSDLSTLSKSGLQTILLVSLVLLIFVGWREALIAAISIPLSFLTAFIGLQYSGNSLNFVSLFALILSIGIIVDSTIVIVEGINSSLRSLHSREDTESISERTEVKTEAALSVVKEFYIPLTTGTLTTVAVFLPLFLVSGVVGQFIKSIPFTIIFVLLASLLVALGFVPFLSAYLLHRGTSSLSDFERKRNKMVMHITERYRRYLNSFLSNREVQNIFFVTMILLFIIALSFPIIGAVKTVFFSDSNADYIFIQNTLPTGTKLANSDMEIRKAEEVLYTIPEIQTFATTVGRGSSFSNPLDGSPTSSAENANIFITLDTNRKRTTTDIVEEIRTKLDKIHTSNLQVQQLSDGPPSLAPVTITLSGNDLNALDSFADKVANVLKSINGTVDITSGANRNTNEFVLTVDRNRVAAQGANIGEIATELRTALYGTDATQIKKLGTDTKVVVRMDLTNIKSSDIFNTNETTIDTIKQIKVHTKNGLAPLSDFVRIAVAPSRASITHKDGERIVTVSSWLSKTGNAVEVGKQFKEELSKLTIPSGISVSVGGENEDINQSFKDMFTSLLIGIISMFAILVLQFNSFRYSLYILSIVPLSLIGVFAGLMITGSPLSFPSMMGFIALAGIVVNNAIIMIDTIHNRRIKETGERTLKETVVDASVSRLRPVLLTALTTVVGMIPLLFAAAIWTPLAYSIMFGLAFATIITLVLVPAIYFRWPGKIN